jgi:hypothetical protein
MSTFKFEGDPEQGGLPRGSMVRLEEFGTRAVVFEGKVNNSAYVDLDPGKYAYSVVRFTERDDQGARDIEDCRYTGEFLHEITEKAYGELKSLKPRLTRTMNTSEGARWRCLVTGCKDEFTTPTAAVIHEVCDHMGVPREEFLANPRAKSRMAGGQKYEKLATQAAEMRNARPRKSAILGVEDEPNEE